jgi:glutathione synthase/RimK-type ligase-like ATP-grasp enzyme/MFS family permease
MKLYFLLNRRVQGVMSPIMVEVWDILSWCGFEVEYGVAEDMVTRPDQVRVGHDLYVLKSRTDLSLSLAGVLHAQGARFLNPYESCVAAQNKIVAARRLRRAGVPTPLTWATGDFSLLEEVVDEMPLVLKPYQGHRGAGIHVVHDRTELAAVPETEVPMLVQEHIEGTGEDLKVYVVGEQVFAVRKQFSEGSFSVAGEPAAVSPEVRDIAQRCGQALGLGLYGLDVIESADGPVVVDVNYYPGYKGVPEIAPVIADYIGSYARGRRTLELRALPPAARRKRRLRAPQPLTRRRSQRREHVEQPPDHKPAKRRRASVNPSLTAIVAEGMLSRLSFGIISFALPLYAYKELGLSLAAVGFLASFNTMVAVALKPAMGSLADRVGLKPSLQAAIGMRSLVSLLLAFVAAPWQLFTVRGLHGVSVSMRDPSVNALIAEHGGKKAIATSFAWYQTAKSLGGAGGKLLGGLLLGLTASNFSLVFLVAFAISALPFFVVARFLRVPKHGEGEYEEAVAFVPDEATGEEMAAVATDSPSAAPRSPDGASGASTEQTRPPIFRFMGLGFFISATATMLTNLFPIFAVEYAGLTEAQAGLIYGLSALMALTGPAFGWLSDNVSRKLVLSVRSAANVLSSVIYWVAPSVGGLAVGRALDDGGKAAYRPAWGALMAHVSGFDRRRRARAMGYMSSGEDAGEITGPILASALWSTWGVAALLSVRIALAIATELYTVALTGSLKRLDSHDKTASPPTPRSRRRRASHRTVARDRVT